MGAFGPLTSGAWSSTVPAVRRAAAPLLVLPLIVSAAACGGDDEDTLTIEATPAAMQQAAEETLDAGTGRYEATMTMELMGRPITMDITGAFDGPAELGSTEIDMSSIVGSLGEALPAGMAAGFDRPMEIVMDGSVMYMCWDLLETVAGSRCGSVDISETTGVPIPTGNTDPTSFTRALAGADNVQELGNETVDGVETQHFQGTFRLDTALDELDPEQAAAVEASFEQLGADAQATEFPFEAWVDADGRIRRMVSEFDVAGVSASIDEHFFDFGDDVDIQVPEGDIADLGALFEQLGGLGG